MSKPPGRLWLPPTNLSPPVATYQHQQSNLFAILDKQDPEDDDVTIMVFNKGRATDDATATTDECTRDNKRNNNEYIPWQKSAPIPAHEIILPAVTPIVPIIFPPQISIPMRSTAWNTIVQDNNLQQLPTAATIFDRPKVCRAVEDAISDSGATSHFLIGGSPVVSKQPATNPLKISDEF